VTVGRLESTDLALPWDDEVSRLHAEVEFVGGWWTISDDGLSRNGTQVNGAPIAGRRRLHDGDLVQVGRTVLGFRAAGLRESGTTAAKRDRDELQIPEVSPAQRRVLVALCRPYKSLDPFATPATNQDIAAEVFLSVDAVKAHLRALFQRFNIEGLPQNQKRARLVELAFEKHVIARRDL
jgi:pSer/pThr/pTyr-binding forkhead associated (FHA) protein